MKGHIPQLLISDSKGEIYNVPYLETAGMKAGCFFRFNAEDLIKLPYGSEIFMLPDRLPVGYDSAAGKFVILDKNPVSGKGKRCFAVAAFISPGYTVGYNSAYSELGNPSILPLFSYAALVFYKGEFYTPVVRVDFERRQDLRFMDIGLVKKNIIQFKKIFPRNRLMKHLEGCALVYGCPAAKNFFLKRYEAPLPTAPYCNARCIGCISYQPAKKCPVTQPRVKFVPTPDEVAEIALLHINNVKDPVVSFGQGCEGEPLVVGDVLYESIKLIRKETSRGIINVNTNASMPETIAMLFDAGLDSIRVSLNSVREEYYIRYFKPKGYKFNDVIKSIKTAKEKKGFVSINYLTMPGFTDTKDEFIAFKRFIKVCHIDMVQLRNLNYDPLRYFKDIKFSTDISGMLGIKEIINLLKKDFPHLLLGYFNPSKMRMKRHSGEIR